MEDVIAPIPSVEYYEVEWLDENGEGHHVSFNINDTEARDKFIKAVEPTCAMIALYHVKKFRM